MILIIQNILLGNIKFAPDQLLNLIYIGFLAWSLLRPVRWFVALFPLVNSTDEWIMLAYTFLEGIKNLPFALSLVNKMAACNDSPKGHEDTSGVWSRVFGALET